MRSGAHRSVTPAGSVHRRGSSTRFDALPEDAPSWFDVICALDGHSDASRLYELPDVRRFVLPLVARPGRHRRVPSMPRVGPTGLPVAGRR